MYRFHPSVRWKKGYPDRQQIVSQVKELWQKYGLDKRTTFNTKVEKIYQNKKKRWVINDPANGTFDGVIVAVGTCAGPKTPHIPGMDEFKGKIYHSSQLDGKKAAGKKVVIIGGGASAVEALEFVASADAANTSILARVSL
jgi:cation diffusion facilitator CzcD-associated flavoprotein CzcO